MTVAAETNRIPYSCNGALVNFDFAFKIFDETDLAVILTDSDGIETTLTLTTHYSVSGSLSSGGKITTVATYASGNTITIMLAMALTQPSDLIYGSSYSSEAVETIGDRAVKMIQQLSEKLTRALTFQATSAQSDIEIPEPVAGYLLGWNTAGTALINIETYSSTVKVIILQGEDFDAALTVADRKARFVVPKELSGMKLISQGAHVYTVSSSGLPTFMIRNHTQSVDMLSAAIAVPEGDLDSDSGTIDTSNNTVTEGDEVSVNCTIAGTGTKGMEIRMGFEK